MLISSANISALTAGPGFWPDAPPQPPKQALIEAACARLSIGDPFNKGAKRFERMAQNPLEGFEIVPVLFAPVNDSHAVRHEYNRRVLEGQYKRLAREHAEALLKANVSPAGLKLMQRGKRPVSAAGHPEKGSLDHIDSIERGGLFTVTKEKDPDFGAETGPRFRINHTGNLIWLVDWAHGLKNRFYAAQCIHNPDVGGVWWGLDMIPVRNDKYDGFVCPPQPEAMRNGRHLFPL